MKETRIYAITVKGNKNDRAEQFKLLGEFTDTEVVELSYPGLELKKRITKISKMQINRITE